MQNQSSSQQEQFKKWEESNQEQWKLAHEALEQTILQRLKCHEERETILHMQRNKEKQKMQSQVEDSLVRMHQAQQQRLQEQLKHLTHQLQLQATQLARLQGSAAVVASRGSPTRREQDQQAECRQQHILGKCLDMSTAISEASAEDGSPGSSITTVDSDKDSADEFHEASPTKAAYVERFGHLV